jgi:hypothetical protein
MTKKQTIEQIEASIARWQTRLRRAVRAVEKLEAQKKRLVKRLANLPDLAIAPPLATAVMSHPPSLPINSPTGNVPSLNQPIDTSIPDFLQRKKLDPVAEQIAAEQQETKTAKARGRIAKMKAKQSGETRRMPLTGKAALAAIRD